MSGLVTGFNGRSVMPRANGAAAKTGLKIITGMVADGALATGDLPLAAGAALAGQLVDVVPDDDNEDDGGVE